VKPKALMVILYTPDVPKAAAFYRDSMGLDLAEQWDGWARLARNRVYPALHSLHGAMSEHQVPFAGLNLQVEDLDEFIARAEAGGAELIKIREPERGALIRLGVMRDPDGNGFELHQRMPSALA